MPFIQNTDSDRAEMLAAIGVKTVDELFEQIPADLRLKGALPIDAGLSEDELRTEMAELAAWNSTLDKGSFLGAGMYRHFIPTVVDSLQSRHEFVTAYTPYQPEGSQGTLTVFFEFQTMVAELLGMEIANASMYDGCSAATEAVIMASNLVRKRTKVVVSHGVHPHTRRTLETYLRWTDMDVVEAPLGADGRTQLDELLDSDTCAVLVQNPNTLGVIEDLDDIAKQTKEAGAISICSAYPTSLGLLKSPGEAGFDIAVGDGQCLGTAPAFGGPSFGLFACAQKHVRKMPGRIVGQTVDDQGRRGFALTFQTREQHIRREKALSNICTNNALIALRGAIYMAAAGPEGLAEVAIYSLAKAQYAAKELSALEGFDLPYADSGHFNEFVLRCPVPAAEVNRAIDRAGMIGGLDLVRWYPELGDNALLLAFTETTTRQQIDTLVKTLSNIAAAAPVA
ncbi:MAG: glycine dehydrogenase subunit 1 [Planctomycetota bacterium]|jgi:glycine dehydrogenase subunit 1